MRPLMRWRNFLPAIVAISLSSILVCSRTHRRIAKSDIWRSARGTDCIFQSNSTAILESDSVHANDLFWSLSDSVVAYYRTSLEILSTDVENAFVVLWIPVFYIFATRLGMELREPWMFRYGIEAVIELREQLDEVKERRTVLKRKYRAFRRFGCFMRRRQTYRPKFRKAFRKHRRRLHVRKQKRCKNTPRVHSVDQPLFAILLKEFYCDVRTNLRKSDASTNDAPNRPINFASRNTFRSTRICYSAPSNLCEGNLFGGCQEDGSTNFLSVKSRRGDVKAVYHFRRKAFRCLGFIPIPRKMTQTFEFYAAGGIEFLPTDTTQLFIDPQLSDAAYSVNLEQKESPYRTIVLEKPATTLLIVKESDPEMKIDRLTLTSERKAFRCLGFILIPREMIQTFELYAGRGIEFLSTAFSGPITFDRQKPLVARGLLSLAETPRTERRSCTGTHDGTELTVKTASLALTVNNIALKVVEGSLSGSRSCETDLDTELNQEREDKGSTTELARLFDSAMTSNSIVCSTYSNPVENKCSTTDQDEEESDQFLSDNIDLPNVSAGINIQEWVDSTKSSYVMVSSERSPSSVAMRSVQTARISYSATGIRNRNRIFEKSASETNFFRSVSLTCLNDVEMITYFKCMPRSSRAIHVSYGSIRTYELEGNVDREFLPRCRSQFSIETTSSDVIYSAGMEDSRYRPIVSEDPETMVSIMKESDSEIQENRMSLISESARENFPRVRRPGHQMLERMNAATSNVSLELSNPSQSSWKSKIRKITAGMKIKKTERQKVDTKELLIGGGRFPHEDSSPLILTPCNENIDRSGRKDNETNASPTKQNFSLTSEEAEPELRSSKLNEQSEVPMAVRYSAGLTEGSSTDSVISVFTVNITIGRRNIPGQMIIVRPADVPRLNLDPLSHRESSASSSSTLYETFSNESPKQQTPSVISTDRRETLAQIPSYLRLRNNLEDVPVSPTSQSERTCLVPSAASEEVSSYLRKLRQEKSQLNDGEKTDFCQRTASANIVELENLETELEHILLSIDKIHNRSKKGFKRLFALCRPRRGKIRRLEKQRGLIENDIEQCNERIKDSLLAWKEVRDENKKKMLQEKLRLGINLQKEAIFNCVREAMQQRRTMNTSPDDATFSTCYDCSVGSHVAELAMPFSNPLLRSEDGFPQTCPVVRAVNTRYNALNLDRVVDPTDRDLETMKMLQKQIEWGLFRKAYLQHGYFM